MIHLCSVENIGIKSATWLCWLALLGILGLTVPVAPAGAVPDKIEAQLQAFGLEQVQLLDGPCKLALEANQRYLLSLQPDELLYTFRKNAGLQAPGRPLDGWEKPDSEVRGHFTGHYLSACALLYANTRSEAIKARGSGLVAELAKCQQALGGEYLSAITHRRGSSNAAGLTGTATLANLLRLNELRWNLRRNLRSQHITLIHSKIPCADVLASARTPSCPPGGMKHTRKQKPLVCIDEPTSPAGLARNRRDCLTNASIPHEYPSRLPRSPGHLLELQACHAFSLQEGSLPAMLPREWHLKLTYRMRGGDAISSSRHTARFGLLGRTT